MVAMLSDHLSGVALVPISMISGVSTIIEKGVPGVMEAPSVNQGEPSINVEVPAPAILVSPSSF